MPFICGQMTIREKFRLLFRQSVQPAFKLSWETQTCVGKKSDQLLSPFVVLYSILAQLVGSYGTHWWRNKKQTSLKGSQRFNPSNQTGQQICHAVCLLQLSSSPFRAFNVALLSWGAVAIRVATRRLPAPGVLESICTFCCSK